MKNFIQFLKDLWAWLSGNKTWVATTALLILKAPELQFIWSLMNQNWYGVFIWFFGILAGIGIVHKIGKSVNKTKNDK